MVSPEGDTLVARPRSVCAVPGAEIFRRLYSRQHIAALEADGRFPERVYLSKRVTAWYLSEILHWMNTRDR
jgi:Prophage CP4-57 regulatory protein (AlpA)